MTDSEKGAAKKDDAEKDNPVKDNAVKADDKGAETSGRRSRRGRSGAAASKVKAGSNAVRSRLASILWLVAVVCALFLAVGALLIALKANEDNSIVAFVVAGAEMLDGPFSLDGGIFTFSGDEDGKVKSALVNWGIAAVVYLVIGKVLDRIVRP